MRRALLIVSLVLVTLFTASVILFRIQEARMDPTQRAAALRAEVLDPGFEKLKALASPLPPPDESDWLASHYEEGQSVKSYRASRPVRPTSSRSVVVLQPLAPFNEREQQLLADTARYVTAFYGLPVRVGEALPPEAIPASARRNHPDTGASQVLTTSLLFEVLRPRLTEDVLAIIGLTSEDLYPDPDWNFVFGQASFKDRIGVWSFHRFGDLEAEGPLVRERTLKTAVHELGHMLGLEHCIAFACVMNGSNNLEEGDRRPMEPCPACLAKLSWNLGTSPEQRYARVLSFYEQTGFDAAAVAVRSALPR
ncbi:MAG: Peptidase family [Myxococcaceae bacterium]|nr:Peptidase family [Myxococcaceae bacterium]